MRIDILTIFPEAFSGVFDVGVIRRARQQGLLDIRLVQLRDFAEDRHRTVDDRPFGGGEGMVLKPEPIFRAVRKCEEESATGQNHKVLLSPQGRRFDQLKAQELAAMEHLILVCGRYEGVDQRVADHLADESISLGDFVISGGEFAAMVLVDAVGRLLPGVVGNPSSVLQDSFMHGELDYPQYTRPAEFRGWRVPEVLLSGDHGRIRAWREAQAMERTRSLRPDLLAAEFGDWKTATEQVQEEEKKEVLK